MSYKQQTINLRVEPGVKNLLSQAAEVKHDSLSNFIRKVAIEEAQRTLEAQKRIKLSLSDFIELSKVMKDDKPNEKLQKAFNKYK